LSRFEYHLSGHASLGDHAKNAVTSSVVATEGVFEEIQIAAEISAYQGPREMWIRPAHHSQTQAYDMRIKRPWNKAIGDLK
jgi:hypothetical protein